MKLALAGIALFLAAPAHALETDQFTVPPQPLYDIGAEVSTRVAVLLGQVPADQNPADVLYSEVGHGLPESEMEKWVAALQAPDGQQILFRPNVFHTIYAWAIAPLPFAYFDLAPTVSMYGIHLGTDKLGHIFQQGYEYYQIFLKSQAAGKSDADAVADAVAKGVKEEKTYYGTAISGVFSNADLSADFGGLKFYRNLTEAVTIGGQTLQPTLVKTDDGWRLRADIDPGQLLKPYMTDHLDESLNPSDYLWTRDLIKHAISKRCESWKKAYDAKQPLVVPVSQSWVQDWNGEPYGHHLDPDRELSIATICH